jgi:hypothetical protein
MVACSLMGRPEPEPIEPSTHVPYDRKAWKHWIDADRDCQSTATEVLVAESLRPVRFADARACRVAEGLWACPYTGERITDPALLDVDHVVPLAHAHAAGGYAWNAARRRAFANDLEHADHLVAVSRRANRQKGARGPEHWLPVQRESRCAYVRTWVNIKQRWALASSPTEDAQARSDLSLCAAGGTPERRPTAKLESTTREDRATCCRTCTVGKPCGDTCIAADHACHQAPGCAC